MDTALTTFTFEGQAAIRVVPGEDGEPRFVAADVCKALGIANVGNALARLDDDEKDNIRLADVMGRMTSVAAVNESGLYNLIIRSDKPEARTFKRWITHDVLPSIRKTGQYNVQQAQPVTLTPLQQLKAMVALMEDHEGRIARLEANTPQAPDYFTVMGYARFIGKTISLNEAQSIGQRAARLSRDLGRSIGKTTDPRFGQVNTYHISILEQVVEHATR